MRQKLIITMLLQSASGITKFDRLLLQSTSGECVTGCYYKVRKVLLSATIFTKWDVTAKVLLAI